MVMTWVAGAVNLLDPLYQHLRNRVLSCDYIQVDESTIPVMDKDKPGATRKGYHWVVRSPEEGCLFFHYDRGSRAGRVAVELLKNFRGAIQSDGYGAYEVYEKKDGVLLLGCWAHARRKFEQALGNDRYHDPELFLITPVGTLPSKITFRLHPSAGRQRPGLSSLWIRSRSCTRWSVG